ncbi:MAG: hypothetical protein U5R31_01340 [Acidimicrobiia bacterium]|nr:hypothetical protein [Acidimicrobiia bacterium]
MVAARLEQADLRVDVETVLGVVPGVGDDPLPPEGRLGLVRVEVVPRAVEDDHVSASARNRRRGVAVHRGGRRGVGGPAVAVVGRARAGEQRERRAEEQESCHVSCPPGDR